MVQVLLAKGSGVPTWQDQLTNAGHCEQLDFEFNDSSSRSEFVGGIVKRIRKLGAFYNDSECC